MAEKKIIDNHVARRLFPVVPDPVDPDGNDIVTYERKQKVTKVGEGPDDYVVGEEVVEVSRVNRQAYIAKDAPDVGVMNILEKVRRSGDITLFNQTYQVLPEGIQDYTSVPDSVGDALAAISKGGSAYSGLAAIFPGLTFEQLAKLTPEEISSYVAKYAAANTPAAESEAK